VVATLAKGSVARRSRWISGAAAVGLVAAGLLASGCSWSEPMFEQSTTAKAPHVAGSGIKVVARNGSVSVAQAAGTEVSITANLKMRSQERLGQVTVVANRDAAGVLVISATPPADGWRGNEGCGFDVIVPEAVGVEVQTSNGRIEVGGLAGAAKLESSNGRITVERHAGDVVAKTSNGRITLNLVAGTVDAHSSNGSITVSLADAAPGPVKIRTSNGTVNLEMGKGFKGTLDIDTSNGSVQVPSAQGVKVTKRGKKSATLVVGEGGGQSQIKTSNGSVTVTVRE